VKATSLAATFERLLTIAQLDHHEGRVRGPGHPWTSADLVAQEALFEIQADLLKLLLDVAEALGPAMVGRLTKALPWAYRSVPA
jgi:hypothetical protein